MLQEVKMIKIRIDRIAYCYCCRLVQELIHRCKHVRHTAAAKLAYMYKYIADLH